MKPLASTLGKVSTLLIAISLNFVINSNSQNPANLGSAATQNLSSGDNNSSEISPEIKSLLQFYDKQIYFTRNEGQWPSGILFKADFPLGQAVATDRGMLVGTFDAADISARYDYGMREEEARKNLLPFNEPKVKVKGHAWMMNFLNHSPLMTVESKTKHADVFNYFNGNTSRTDVSNYQEVWYNNVYDNVNVRYYPSQDGTLEYDILCKQGFNKNAIAIQMDGISKVVLKNNGSLVLKTSIGEMTLPAPVAYQLINDQKVLVDVHYALSGKNIVRFIIGDFDVSKPLIIDPIALRWATLINSNSTGDNHGHCIWVDPSDGAIYVVARVAGSTNLITPGAFDESANGNLETIVGKYNEPTTIGGSGARVWQTYVGGNGDDNPYAMEQGPDGNFYITGYTSSTNFPLLGGTAFSGSSVDDGAQSGDNIFIVKINKDGNSIKSAVVGGNNTDGSFDLRFAPDGGIVICGNTRSTNLNTIHPNLGASNTNNGSLDAVVFKINSDLSSLAWIRNFGGSSQDQATIMLGNPVNGDIYVAGYTSSPGFPTLNARQSSIAGSTDGFIQKYKSNGVLVWSSYFNSAAFKNTNILCMEFNMLRNKLYFAGTTGGLAVSNTSASGTYDNTYNGGNNDFFVVSMDTNQTFNASTYIGGAANEVNMMGLNVDLNNDVYVFGYTNSTNFPTSTGALQSQLNNTAINGTNPPNDKAFFKLSTSLSSLLFSTYYGGTLDDYDPVGERGIKFSNCRIYTIVTGRSNNLPLTQGAITTMKLSATSVYEPGLVVWANPPDLANNSILGNQTVCYGSTPISFTGTQPSYVLPNISRNGVSTPYPVVLNSANTYQWQKSTDSINWVNITGGTSQNLNQSLIGSIFQKTYFRRIIGGDACVIAGAANQFIVVDILTISGNVHNVTCYGAHNGSITAVPNGSSNYGYTWNTGATTQSITNLGPGTYTVTVTDIRCSVTNSFVVTEPSALSATTTSTSANCNKKDGSVSVIASGGTPNYSYLWSNGSHNSTVEGLLSGVYSVTVTDNNGCTYVAYDTVQSINTLSLSEAHTPVLCHGGSSTVTISASGGEAPYAGTGSFTQAAGTLSYLVTDNNGCDKYISVTVLEPADLSLDESHTPILCNGGSSTVTVSAAGGVPPYSGTGNFTQNAGTITYTVTDANGCQKSVVAVVAEPALLSASESHTAILCHGDISHVTISASGGQAPYTGIGTFAQNAGTSSYTVTDANGCSFIVDATVSEPESLSASESHTAILCHGGSSDVTIAASGGVGPYTGVGTFSQTEGTVSYTVVDANGCSSSIDATVSEDQVLSASETHTPILCHGDHSTVTINATGGVPPYAGTGSFEQSAGIVTYAITDANGCSYNVDVYVPQPQALSADESHTPIQCHGGASTVTINASGGTGPYTGTGSFEQNAGTTTYTITDANGCSANVDATVSEPEAISASETHTPILCHGSSSTVTITATGGEAPYTGTGLFDQSAGTVTYTITDAKGCSTTIDATVAEPDLLAASELHSAILCHDASATVTISASGGAEPYTGTGIFSQAAGMVTYTITDANGCSTTVDATISEPDALSASETHTPILCNGGSSEVVVVASGGVGPYTGVGHFSQGAGHHTYFIQDANGCSASVMAAINQPDPIDLVTAILCLKPKCYGDNTGSIDITPVGGTAPYTYIWDDGTTTEDRAGLYSGFYTVTATDANGCSATLVKEVGTPAQLVINETHVNVSTNGGHNGSIDITVTGGSGNKKYLWNDGNKKEDRTGLYAGTYTVTVTDGHGCTASATIVISQPPLREMSSDGASINIYPNPATSEFVVELTVDDANDAPFRIQLVNAIGQILEVKTGQFVNGNLREVIKTTTQMSAGVYEVQIIWNDEMIVRPVAITK